MNELLGSLVVVKTNKGVVKGRITEVTHLESLNKTMHHVKSKYDNTFKI